MQSVTPLRQGQHVAAHDVGEGVVQAPEVFVLRPLGVFGVVPLVENWRRRMLRERDLTDLIG